MGQGYSTVIQDFLRIYIVVGFIVAVLLNVYIIRKLNKLEDEIQINRTILHNHVKVEVCQPSAPQAEEPGPSD